MNAIRVLIAGTMTMLLLRRRLGRPTGGDMNYAANLREESVQTETRRTPGSNRT